jgi:phosphoribosylanthranilate isomerase
MMQSRLYIKICGITNSVDAGAALLAGADAIGFISYHKSPRFFSPEKVKKILNAIDASGLQKVGVFVDEGLDFIREYIDAGIDTVQLHGSESPDFADKCAEFAEVWKVIRPESEEDIERFAEFPADKFLIDAFHKDLHGGTGSVIDPEIAKFAVGYLQAPVILAGGISPDNCVEIAVSLKPFGLDINSGVEKSPGIKDHYAIEKLFQNLKNL